MTDNYKQAYVVTMESAAVILVVVSAATQTAGQKAAKKLAEKVGNSSAWDICAFPTTSDLDEGARVLRPLKVVLS